MNAYDEDATPVHEFGGHPDMSFAHQVTPSNDEPVQETVVVDGEVVHGRPYDDDEGLLRVDVASDEPDTA